jgi:hypothetical protein
VGKLAFCTNRTSGGFQSLLASGRVHSARQLFAYPDAAAESDATVSGTGKQSEILMSA